MTTWALRLRSPRTPNERILPMRFDDWQKAARLARLLSNDPFWQKWGWVDSFVNRRKVGST